MKSGGLGVRVRRARGRHLAGGRRPSILPVAGAARDSTTEAPLADGAWSADACGLENRRQHARTRVDCAVQLQPLGGSVAETDACAHYCVSLDMSGGGMRVWTARSYPVGAQALLSFECDKGGVCRVTACLVSVVWSAPSPLGHQWEIGLRFGDGRGPAAAPFARGCVWSQGEVEVPGRPRFR